MFFQIISIFLLSFVFVLNSGFASLRTHSPSEILDKMGFSEVSRRGITGKGANLAFYERIFSITSKGAPSYLSDCELFDCSSHGKALEGCKDVSKSRYTCEEAKKVVIDLELNPSSKTPDTFSFESHDAQVLEIGKKFAPDAKYRVYNFSVCSLESLSYPSCFGKAGFSIYSFEEILSKIKRPDFSYKKRSDCSPWLLEEKEATEKERQFLSNIQKSLTNKVLKENLSSKKVDGSFLSFFEHATRTKKSILNLSTHPEGMVDPFGEALFTKAAIFKNKKFPSSGEELYRGIFTVPTKVLDQIGNLLEKSDSIVVFAASNEYTKMYMVNAINAYLRAFATHPILKKRTLIAINVVEKKDIFSKEDKDFEYENRFRERNTDFFKVALPNGEVTELTPYWSSNFPMSDWPDSGVCGLGSHILFDGAEKAQSGTSYVAPQVSALCGLVWSKNPDMNGPEVVERVKSTATKFGTKELFGQGVINPIKALS